jgi:hypothetical protein
MVGILALCAPHALSIAVMPEPMSGGGIERWLFVVAQERYGISFDVAAQAVWAGRIFNCQPEEGHATNDPTDLAFQSVFTPATM